MLNNGHSSPHPPHPPQHLPKPRRKLLKKRGNSANGEGVESVEGFNHKARIIAAAALRLARLSVSDYEGALKAEIQKLGLSETEADGLDKKAKRERQKALRRVKALRSKTVENGCTEAEAINAAKTAEALIENYNFDASELEAPEVSDGLESNYGSELLELLEEVLKTYIAFPAPHCSLVLALWVMHTYVFDAFRVTPYLVLESAGSNCGKSTVLYVLNHLAARPKLIDRSPPVSMAKTIDKERPTLLLNEADNYLLPQNHYMINVLNSGHNSEGRISTPSYKDGERIEQEYSVFCPKAIAFRNDHDKRLHKAILSRSIIFHMLPAQVGQIERFDPKRHGKILATLKWQIEQWAAENFTNLEESNPAINQINRTADNWRPLLAIADLIGGDLSSRARSAMNNIEAQTGTQVDEHIRLLLDCETVFHKELASSEELITAICKLPESEWANHKGTSKPITREKFAALLLLFGLKTHKQSSGPHRGRMRWCRSDFEPVWKAYASRKK